MVSPIYSAVIYGAFPLLFLLVLPLLLHLLLLPLWWVVVPALVALVYRCRRTKSGPVEGVRRYPAIVVGAGFSGLCAGARLLERGIPFTIFEAAAEVGGTWHHNSYPGAACDVWTTLYQFSFFQNPDWTRFVAPAKEIQEYLVSFTSHFHLYPHIKLNTRVESAVWEEEEGEWKVVTSTGGVVRCRILVSAVGALHKPVIPGIPGTATFAGPSWHTAQWEHTVPLQGKRVGIIGSAASAVQVVPAIAGQVAALHVFQRTPNWFFPKMDPVYPGWLKAMFRSAPFLMTLQRTFFFYMVEGWALLWLTKGWCSSLVQCLLESKMRSELSGASSSLTSSLVPDYTLGCKRVLLSDEYLATFRDEAHVSLVTSPITRVTEAGVETEQGEVELDVLVYATGFDIEGSICSFPTTGRSGKVLREQFAAQPCAFLGITVPNFPNFFYVLGPNTVLAHSSLVFMVECQVDYIVQTVEKMAALKIKSLEPRQDCTLDFQAKMSLWTQGRNFSTECRSWYKNSQGINFILWPVNLVQYWWMTRSPDLLHHYRLTFGQEYFHL